MADLSSLPLRNDADADIRVTANAVVDPVADRGVWRGAIAFALIAIVAFGIAYPLAGVGLGQALFPAMAAGSLIERDGRVVGSALVAQAFGDDRYVQPRPSAADYDPMKLAGSNQARTNAEMRARIGQALDAVAAREGVDPSRVPSDLVTQSGGAIDPHLSPEAVEIQIARVARARGMAEADVRRLVAANTDGPQFGVLGATRINVVLLNLALDAASAPRPGAGSTPASAR